MGYSRPLIWIAVTGLLTGLSLHALATNPPPPATAQTAGASPASDGNLLELPSLPASPAPPAAATPAVPPLTNLPATPSPAPVTKNIPAPVQALQTPNPPIAPAVAAQKPAKPVPVPVAPRLQPQAPAPASTMANAANASASAEFAKALKEVGARNPDILMEPPHLDNTSLMFSKSDMHVISEALNVYDNSGHAQKMEVAKRDDLTSLLDSLKANAETEPSVAPTTLPNLYLGSIVFYSSAQWSVWLNGKKLLNRNNLPSSEFYVSAVSRSAVELVWKPASLLDMPSLWRRATDNGAHPLTDITVDESRGTVTLHLHPNQTFLPRSLTIREGLIRTMQTIPGDVSARLQGKPQQ